MQSNMIPENERYAFNEEIYSSRPKMCPECFLFIVALSWPGTEAMQSNEELVGTVFNKQEEEPTAILSHTCLPTFQKSQSSLIVITTSV